MITRDYAIDTPMMVYYRHAMMRLHAAFDMSGLIFTLPHALTCHYAVAMLRYAVIIRHAALLLLTYAQY